MERIKPNCEKCIKGEGCKEGCSFWFLEDLKEAGFKGIFINEQGEKIKF